VIALIYSCTRRVNTRTEISDVLKNIATDDNTKHAESYDNFMRQYAENVMNLNDLKSIPIK
jgi:hypothetical protein